MTLHTINMHMNKVNCDSSNDSTPICPFKQWFDILYIALLELVTHLQYEYAQVVVDLFYEMSHLSVVHWWFAFTFSHFSCTLKGGL